MKRAEFEEQWAEHCNDVFYFLIAMTPQRADAEDLLQAVALKAYRKYSMVRKTESFKAWIIKVAQNTAFDFLRQYRKQTLNQPLLDVDELDAYLARQNRYESEKSIDIRMSVESFVQGLPEKWRHALHLNIYYEMSYSEISKAMGISYTVIYKRLVKLKQLLQDALEGE